MKQPAAAKTRRPRIDKVKNLAAGIRRALQESGWSERGLSMAAGCKPDRLRNVGRGLSSTLPADVIVRVADVLAVPAAALTGAEPWPPHGARLKKSEPPEERQAAAPPQGSLVELAAEARRVAVEARAAVRVAVAAAEAAEKVAAWAEAAAAVPPESAESAFERWTADVQAKHTVQHRATKIHSPGAPNDNPSPSRASSPRYQPPTKAEIAADPARFMPIDKRSRKPPADLLDQLEWWLLGNASFIVDRQLKLVFINRQIAGEQTACVAVEAVGLDKIHVHDLELDVDVGDYDDAKVAAQEAKERSHHRQEVEEIRLKLPEACAYMRALGAGEHAEKHYADWVQRVATYDAIETLQDVEWHVGHMLPEHLRPGWFKGRPGEETKADAAAISALIVAADRVGRFDRQTLLKASRLADVLATRVRDHRTVLLDSRMAIHTSEFGTIAALQRSGERLRELMRLPAGAPELVIPPPAPAEVLTKSKPGKRVRRPRQTTS